MDMFVHLLLLIIIANGAPVFVSYVCGSCCAWPVDFGKLLFDGQPVLGKSKTWRGLLAAMTVTPVCAWLLGHSPETGGLIAVFSMLGDLLSSFIKRRMKISPSSMSLFLDQVPEALLPAVVVMNVFYLDIVSVVLLVSLFVVAELLLSRILYKWGVRQRPY